MTEPRKPLYVQIYDYVLQGIHNGKYNGNKRLPTEKELCAMFHVSRITSKKALEMLVEDNLIVRTKGKGSYVSKDWNQALKNPGIATSRQQPSNKGMIGVVLPDFSEAFGMEILAGIESQCPADDCFCVIRRSRGNQAEEDTAIDNLIAMGVAGIAIMPVHGEYYSAKILRLILDGFPIVVMDRELRGVPSIFIGTHNIEGAQKGMDHLFDLGHESIAFFSPPPANTSTLEERIDGAAKAYADRNILPDKNMWYTDILCTLPMNNTVEAIQNDISNIKSYISEHPQITAAFASEYNIALIVKEALRAMRKSVPRDFSIVCFDSPSHFLQDYSTQAYEFTHIRQNQREMGKNAVETLKKVFDGDDPPQNTRILLETTLVTGRSTAPPPLKT